ncbi:MAG: DUF1554 domain-containing protein [Bacteriovoracia bacterium]
MASLSRRVPLPIFLLVILILFSACGQSKGYSPNYSGGGAASKIKYKIFVTTRNDLSGALLGTAGADLYCNADAQAGNDTYKALISVTSRQAPSADWPLKANTTYYRIDGTTEIGTTTAGAIFSGTLTNSVNASNSTVWTGLSSGFIGNNECSGFTSTVGTAHTGQSDQTSVASMISNGTSNCTSTLSLYCVQQ